MQSNDSRLRKLGRQAGEGKVFSTFMVFAGDDAQRLACGDETFYREDGECKREFVFRVVASLEERPVPHGPGLTISHHVIREVPHAS